DLEVCYFPEEPLHPNWVQGTLRPTATMPAAGAVTAPDRLATACRTDARSLLPGSFPWVEPEFENTVEGVRALGFSPDGRWLAVGGNRGTLRVWDVESWSEQLNAKDGQSPVEWVGFSPDCKQLAVAREGEVRSWDLASKKRLATIGDKSVPAVLCG